MMKFVSVCTGILLGCVILPTVQESREKVEPVIVEASPTMEEIIIETEPEIIIETEPEKTYLGEWYVTGYTDAPEENGGYTTDCKGRELIEWYTAANNDLPLGTMVEVEGLGVFEIRDRGVNGEHIDICVDTVEEAYRITGNRKVWVVE